jgi:hypothetical protein
MSKEPDIQAESASVMEKAVTYAKVHPNETVHILVPDSFYESFVRRRTPEPLPENISFVPLKECPEAFEMHHKEKFFVAPECKGMMNSKILDALAKVMMG